MTKKTNRPDLTTRNLTKTRRDIAALDKRMRDLESVAISLIADGRELMGIAGSHDQRLCVLEEKKTAKKKR